MARYTPKYRFSGISRHGVGCNCPVVCHASGPRWLRHKLNSGLVVVSSISTALPVGFLPPAGASQVTDTCTKCTARAGLSWCRLVLIEPWSLTLSQTNSIALMRRSSSKIFRTNWSGLRLESQQGLWEKLGPITAATSVRRLRSSRLPQAESLSILRRSEEHTSELQSIMPISYAVSCL